MSAYAAASLRKKWYTGVRRIKMRIQIPENAQRIIEILTKHGYEAYVVGGCVRDSMLLKKPMDWDITTSASPEQIKKHFRRTVDTGIAHGTVTVLMDQEAYEVTTYRIDGEYEDHRRPKEVTFTASLMEDLRRRDFTINAMAYNKTDGLIDLFHGTEDLKKGMIRCVGRAQDRFNEDALRMLRAVRFAAQLGFQIEEETKEAIRIQSAFLKDISAERIQVELTKLLCSAHPEHLIVASQLGITTVVFPEFDQMLATKQENPHHCYNVGEHCIHSAQNIDPNPILRWTMVLHDICKPMTKTMDERGIAHFHGHAQQGSKAAKTVLRRLKLDNHTIQTVTNLIYWHDYRWGEKVDTKRVRRAASKIGPDLFPDLLKVQRADVLAQSEYLKKEKLNLLDEIEQLFEEIKQEQECLSLKEMKINGSQLIEMGISPGKEMGHILNALLDMVIEDPSLNDNKTLQAIVKKRWLSDKK